MTIEYPSPTLTPEEEAAALVPAQHDDEVGDFGAEEGTYVTLRAQTEGDAIAEAGMLWRDGDHTTTLSGMLCGATIGATRVAGAGAISRRGRHVRTGQA
jgi:hypothetical protein